MIETLFYNASQAPSDQKLNEIVHFLHEQLQEWGDPREHIQECLDYCLQKHPSPGGFIVLAQEDDRILGAVVVNRTGMKNYIPENILVYIAVHQDTRGRGVGKRLMNEAISKSEGDIALHVEPDNPAKFLYEKLGFENKYLEMRLKKS